MNQNQDQQELSDYLECEKIWNFLKEHPVVLKNHAYWGRAQGAFDVKNLASLKELEVKVLQEADLPKIHEFVVDYFTNRNDLRVIARADVALEGKNVEFLVHLRNHIWADHLDQMQKKENDGRGVSCVRQIASTIARHDIEGAKVHIHTEWDKIATYPTIAKYLQEQGLADKDWPVHEE